MKAKEYAHCGFPEVGYQKYADMLVDMGFKVARIEQTETPAVHTCSCQYIGVTLNGLNFIVVTIGEDGNFFRGGAGPQFSPRRA